MPRRPDGEPPEDVTLEAYRQLGHSEASSLLRWLIGRISQNGAVTREELIAELHSSSNNPSPTGNDTGQQHG